MTQITSQEFPNSKSFNVEDKTANDKTGHPAVTQITSQEFPKQVNSRVRELVKKIENHPDRHALQQDLQQNKAYKPFSAKSKQMIQDYGNVELFETVRDGP